MRIILALIVLLLSHSVCAQEVPSLWQPAGLEAVRTQKGAVFNHISYPVVSVHTIGFFEPGKSEMPEQALEKMNVILSNLASDQYIELRGTASKLPNTWVVHGFEFTQAYTPLFDYAVAYMRAWHLAEHIREQGQAVVIGEPLLQQEDRLVYVFVRQKTDQSLGHFMDEEAVYEALESHISTLAELLEKRPVLQLGLGIDMFAASRVSPMWAVTGSLSFVVAPYTFKGFIGAEPFTSSVTQDVAWGFQGQKRIARDTDIFVQYAHFEKVYKEVGLYDQQGDAIYLGLHKGNTFAVRAGVGIAYVDRRDQARTWQPTITVGVQARVF